VKVYNFYFLSRSALTSFSFSSISVAHSGPHRKKNGEELTLTCRFPKKETLEFKKKGRLACQHAETLVVVGVFDRAL